MTVEDILKDWLKEHGFDGLCNPEERCDCGLDDFCPCGYPQDCVSAKKKIATAGDIDEYSEYKIGDEIFVTTKEEEKK